MNVIKPFFSMLHVEYAIYNKQRTIYMHLGLKISYTLVRFGTLQLASQLQNKIFYRSQIDNQDYDGKESDRHLKK